MEFIDNITPSLGTYMENTGHTGNAINAKNDRYKEWLSIYAPNAYQAALLNYQNEYDRPINQMLRWQEAGLNPYAFQPSTGATGSQGAAVRSVSSGPERAQALQGFANTALKGVSTIAQAANAAKEIYDYMNYGYRTSFYNSAQAEYNSQAAAYRALTAENEYLWNSYWNTGQDAVLGPDGSTWMNKGTPGQLISNSPRGHYMQNSSDRIAAQINQLNYMVNELYPSQKDANAARAALTDYQKQVMQGQNDAVLKINTGNTTADMVLKLITFWLMSSFNVGSLAQFM